MKIKEGYEENMNELQEEMRKARDIEDSELRQKEINRILAEMKKIVNIDEEEKDEVLDTIQKIRNKYGDYTLGLYASDFLNGGCYYFAYMLKEIYQEKASIYVSCNDEIHAIVKIGDKFYDADGVFDDESKIKKFYEADEQDFDNFVNICYIWRNKNNIKSFESRCDAILEEIKEEMSQNQEKIPKM